MQRQLHRIDITYRSPDGSLAMISMGNQTEDSRDLDNDELLARAQRFLDARWPDEELLAVYASHR